MHSYHVRSIEIDTFKTFLNALHLCSIHSVYTNITENISRADGRYVQRYKLILGKHSNSFFWFISYKQFMGTKFCPSFLFCNGFSSTYFKCGKYGKRMMVISWYVSIVMLWSCLSNISFNRMLVFWLNSCFICFDFQVHAFDLHRFFMQPIN